MRQFMLPDLGEGLEEAEIVTWHVNEGDRVVVDQPLVSVETDKAVVEVPSPQSGRIARLFGGKGDLIKGGAALVEFAEDGQGQDTGTVVGELGPSETAAREAEAPTPAPARTVQVLPAVRALARKLEVDLNLVQATGPGGTITRADVERAAKCQARTTQYFEMFGMRALYHEGWMASPTPYQAPWKITDPTPNDIVNGVKWELYNIAKDWTQFDDVAAANPAKLKELQDLFWVEAQKYQVLPLDASSFTRVVAQRPSITAGRAEFTYVKPITGILPGNEPNILNKSYVITAEITV